MPTEPIKSLFAMEERVTRDEIDLYTEWMKLNERRLLVTYEKTRANYELNQSRVALLDEKIEDYTRRRKLL